MCRLQLVGTSQATRLYLRFGDAATYLHTSIDLTITAFLQISGQIDMFAAKTANKAHVALYGLTAMVAVGLGILSTLLSVWLQRKRGYRLTIVQVVVDAPPVTWS